MIETSFQLFLLIKFERVNRRYRALHCLAGLAPLIFWFTHHGPRWPISAEKRREALFFGRNWPPGPMMGDPKNQGCHLINAPPNNADFLRFLTSEHRFENDKSRLNQAMTRKIMFFGAENFIDFRRKFVKFRVWQQDYGVFSRFSKKKAKNSLIGPRNDFSKIAIFQWFLLIKTIENLF